MGEDTWKDIAQKHWRKVKLLASIIIIIAGFLIAYYLPIILLGFQPILFNLGIFISTVFAVQLVYELVFKSNDQEFVREELTTLWEKKVPQIIDSNIQFYESGRKQEHEKIEFYQKANSEIIEIGTALNTFANRFSSASDTQFRSPLENLLAKGVNIKLFLIDPKSKAAEMYDIYSPGSDPIVEKIDRSIETFGRIISEIDEKKYSGKIELFSYDYLPLLNGVFLDFNSSKPDVGEAFVSHYIPFMEKRSENPGFSFSKKYNPVLYRKYYKCVEELRRNGKKIA